MEIQELGSGSSTSRICKIIHQINITEANKLYVVRRLSRLTYSVYSMSIEENIFVAKKGALYIFYDKRNIFVIFARLVQNFSIFFKLIYNIFQDGDIATACGLVLTIDADPPDLWIRICILKVRSRFVWRDTDLDLGPGHLR